MQPCVFPSFHHASQEQITTSHYWFHRVFDCLTKVTLPRVLRSALTTGETPWSGLVGFTFPERNQRQQLQQNLNYYIAFISCFGILSSVSSGETNVLPQQKGEKTVSVDFFIDLCKIIKPTRNHQIPSGNLPQCPKTLQRQFHVWKPFSSHSDKFNL